MYRRFVRVLGTHPRKSAAALVAAGWLNGYFARNWRAGCERQAILGEAKAIGDEPLLDAAPPRHLTVIINQMARGDALNVFKNEVAPVFHMAGIDLKPHQTKYPGHARDLASKLDVSKTSGVVVVGGDGTLQEVLTGLLRREDRQEVVEKLAVGVIPLGTSHAVGELLHVHPSTTVQSRCGRAALAIARAHVRPMDVMAITNSDNRTVFAMTGFGTGLFGGIATRAVRTWPGASRYSVAGLMTLLTAWPYDNELTLSRRVDMDGALDWQLEPGFWETSVLSRGDVLVSNLSSLGLGRQLATDLSPDDGRLRVFTLPDSLSAMDVVKIGRDMAAGTPLSEHPMVESHVVRELELRVQARGEGEEPQFNVDGESFDPMPVRVRVYPRAIRLFVPEALQAGVPFPLQPQPA